MMVLGRVVVHEHPRPATLVLPRRLFLLFFFFLESYSGAREILILQLCVFFFGQQFLEL